MRYVYALFLLIIVSVPASAQEIDLATRLKKLSAVASCTAIDTPKGYAAAFDLRIKQPVDHDAPAGPTFTQRVFLSHLDPSRPVVLVTEGYAAGGNRLSEPTRILKANQIVVEHRFFGASRPDSIDWKLLTVRQSAADLHAIVTMLKQIYPGKWVSTGVSKGGQTTCLYRYFYPEDVAASIPYVAPINIAQEDPRPTEFLRHVGPDSVRRAIHRFQVNALLAEEEALVLLDTLARQKEYVFSNGKRLMYEYAVLEYPFAFWQYHGLKAAGRIPGEGATPKEIVTHLDEIANLSMFADKGVSYFAPFQYQAYTQMGYYTYDISDLKQYLRVLKNPSNSFLAPPGVELNYDCGTFQKINRWLRYDGGNFIYIYGENDPWTACAIQLTGVTNSVRLIVAGGTHGANVRQLDPAQQQQVLTLLEEWVGVKGEIPPPSPARR